MTNPISIYTLSGPNFEARAKLLNEGSMEQIDGVEIHKFRSSEPLKCLVRKKSFGDMIWSASFPKHCFISERLLGIFQEEKLTGFETAPATMNLVFEHEPADRVFHQLIFTGWGGVADPRSGIVQIVDERSKYAYSEPKNRSLIFDQSQWDGSDFFLIFPLTGSRFISERVRQILGKLKIKRYECSEIAQLARGCPTLLPAPLRCYYTDERAKELGGKLGIDWWEPKQDDS
jgi:hypothetical protein